MPEDKQEMIHICYLPTEILLQIFTYLHGRELARSRRVCVRWKSVIDRLVWSEALWREHCWKEFPSVYRDARRKCKPGLLWFHIYRSLSLWPRLNLARELHDEFSPASSLIDEILDLKVLGDGVIGVHKNNLITYYDIDTLEPSKRGTISGPYVRWTENYDTIIIMSTHLHLYIIRKLIHRSNLESDVAIDDVIMFLLVEREVYYVTRENDIYVVSLDDANLSTNFLQHCPEQIQTLGFTDRLYALSYGQKIYAIDKGNLIVEQDLHKCPTLLHQLHKCGFIENADWRLINTWHCVWGQTIPEGPLRGITVVKVYGDVIFVGTRYGVMRIYYKPFIEGIFDFYHCEPLKQYNFMERSDCPVLSDACEICQVDVMETQDGHTVFVAMPKKIAVVHLIHSFKRTASLAMLPYSSAQAQKVLKTEGADQ